MKVIVNPGKSVRNGKLLSYNEKTEVARIQHTMANPGESIDVDDAEALQLIQGGFVRPADNPELPPALTTVTSSSVASAGPDKQSVANLNAPEKSGQSADAASKTSGATPPVKPVPAGTQPK